MNEDITFIPVFALVWIAITGLIAHVGGWATLAAKYRSEGVEAGEIFRFVSGSMGSKFFPANYGNCLFVTVNSSGFRISILFPFRFQSPPLFVPWSEVKSVTEKRFLFFFRYVVIVIRDQWPRVSLRGGVTSAVLQAYLTHKRAIASCQV